MGEVGEEQLRAIEMDVTGRVGFLLPPAFDTVSLTLYRSYWHLGVEPGLKSSVY